MDLREVALSAYHGYVGSVLQYGLLLWGVSLDFDRAFRAQNYTHYHILYAKHTFGFLQTSIFKKYNVSHVST